MGAIAATAKQEIRASIIINVCPAHAAPLASKHWAWGSSAGPSTLTERIVGQERPLVDQNLGCATLD